MLESDAIGKVRHVFTAIVLACALTASASAITNDAASLNAGGALVSNGVCSTVATVSQQGFVGQLNSPAGHSYLGFLAAFVANPGVDADGDGRCDENDTDDDDDGLTDQEELSGATFDPATATDPLRADTDGDGSRDEAEALAGTNPRDALSLLRITSVLFAGGRVEFAWQSREGRQYEILKGETPGALSTAPLVLDTVTAGIGTGPWKESESSFSELTDDPTGFYTIRLYQE